MRRLFKKQPKVLPPKSDAPHCHACAMPMTKHEDFAQNSCYCRHCYKDGSLRQDVTIDTLAEDIENLIDIESTCPNLLSKPLLNYITQWIKFDKTGQAATIDTLQKHLMDGQDCDFSGTKWEKDWITNGKICRCLACTTARRCISDIKLMNSENNK